MTLSRDQILAADDLPRIQVQTPEWGGSIYVRVLTGAERDQLESEFSGKGKTLANFRARFTALTACDEAGVRLFTAKDVDTLAGKSSVVLDRIVTAASKHNRLGAEEVKTLVGESTAVQSADSGTGLPSTSA